MSVYVFYGLPSTVGRVIIIKRGGRHDRLILVAFGNFIDKLTIMKNKKNLRGSNIFLQDDRTPEQRERFKQLWKA